MKTIYAKSKTESGLKGLIAEFYYSDPRNFELREDGSVYSKTKGKALKTMWEKRKTGYYFGVENEY